MRSNSGTIAAAEVTILPAPLADGACDFSISCELGTHPADVYYGTVEAKRRDTGAAESVTVFLNI
jgi:hypothetical protein